MFTGQLSGLVFLKADRHERPAKGKMRSIVGRCIIPGIYVGFRALSWLKFGPMKRKKCVYDAHSRLPPILHSV